MEHATSHTFLHKNELIILSYSPFENHFSSDSYSYARKHDLGSTVVDVKPFPPRLWVTLLIIHD